MRFIIATRIDPLLPLARLRVRGALTEVRANDLRFTSEEAAAFLTEVMGLPLSSEHIAALEALTEGWIAGLHLAALSMQGRDDFSGFIAAFSGSNRYVGDYLIEEVLQRQPEGVQQFLLHTCILDHLNSSLCDAVRGRDDSQAMLEHLERANLFLIPLDDERQWYRYHHLFAEVLRHRLQKMHPTLAPQLHHRASAWYEQHELFIEAVQHALAAPNSERAALLIEQIGLSMALRGQVHMVLKWLNALPDALVRARPRLCLSHAVMLMLTNQLEAAETRLHDVEQGVQANMPNDQVRVIRGQIAVTRANLVRSSGDLAHAVALVRHALELLPETDRFRPPALVGVAHSYLLSGDVPPAADQQAVAVVASLRTSDDLFAFLQGITGLARLQGLQGQLRRAAATYGEAVRVLPGQGGLRSLVGSPAYYFGLGDLLREWNELDVAERYLSDGMDLVRGTLTVFADEVTLGYITLARLQQARGEYNQAFATLDTFTQLARQRHFVPHLVSHGAAVRAQIELAQGKLAAAVHWADTSDLSINDDLSYPREREYLTLARVRIAQGRGMEVPRQAQGTAPPYRARPKGVEVFPRHRGAPMDPFLQDALVLLDRLLQDAEAKARIHSVIEILVLCALARDAHGDTKSALTLLERALVLAEPGGYIRLFLDEGPLLLFLLSQLQATHHSTASYLQMLLATAAPPESKRTTEPLPAPAHTKPLQPLVDPLS